MNVFNVFVLCDFTGQWPTPVLAVILAKDRYDAMDKAQDFCEARELDYGDYDLNDAFEHQSVEEVYVV